MSNIIYNYISYFNCTLSYIALNKHVFLVHIPYDEKVIDLILEKL